MELKALLAAFSKESCKGIKIVQILELLGTSEEVITPLKSSLYVVKD